MHQRDRLGGGQADNHPADQAGASRGGHAGELHEADIGLAHRARDHAVEQIDMRARRNLGNHTAIRCVILDLRMHDVGENPTTTVAATLNHGRCGFVASGLDPQHQRGCVNSQIEPLRLQADLRFAGSA